MLMNVFVFGQIGRGGDGPNRDTSGRDLPEDWLIVAEEECVEVGGDVGEEEDVRHHGGPSACLCFEFR